MQRITLGTLSLKRPYVLPDAKSYQAVFGYVQRTDALTRLFADADGRNRLLVAHNDDVANFREDQEVPFWDVFDATKFKPKPRREE